MKVKTLTKKDFAWTKWTSQDIKSIVPKVLAHKKKIYAEIKKIPKDKRTFENTVYALEDSDTEFSTDIKAIDALSMVSPDNKVRKTAIKIIAEIEKKIIDIEYDKGLYKALLEYQNGSYKKEKLLPEDKKLLRDSIKGYKRMGFDLPKKDQKTFKIITKRLSKLGNDFAKNLNEYKDNIWVTKEELKGLPDRYIKSLKKGGNKYKVTLEYPDIVPFMANAESDKKRKELIEKDRQKGGARNMRILEEALRLRHKRAKLLGYKSHSHFVLERRMAKTPAKVLNFINGLSRKLHSKARREFGELNKLKQKIKKDKKAKIAYYDSAYFAERLKERKLNLNSEKIREYFPIERVVKGTFEIYQKLLGVTFRELKNYPLWHDDARLFSVSDKEKTISYFLLDLYPRENKYGHACAKEIISGRTIGFRGITYQAPLALMITNFPKPHPGTPSLLSHGEVETFFHEFGHVMHAVLTKARHPSQSGYNASWDFVEAPSQMLENWTWNEAMIKLLSGHYQTCKPLPKKDLKNLLRGKNFLICRQAVRQLAFAYFDFKIHSENPPKNIAQLFRKIIYDFSLVKEPTSSIFPAGFGHLMGGYDSGYYGYMWSKVYASDMFTRFKKEGLLNKKTGGEYRREILEVGSSREEIDSVRAFLGRKPNNKAFLKEIGL